MPSWAWTMSTRPSRSASRPRPIRPGSPTSPPSGAASAAAVTTAGASELAAGCRTGQYRVSGSRRTRPSWTLP